MRTTPCATCGAPVTELERFPGGVCLKCHAAKYEHVPLEQLPPPDFIGAIRLRPARRRRR